MPMNEKEHKELTALINTGMIPAKLEYRAFINEHLIDISNENYANAVKDMLDYDTKLDRAQKKIEELEQFKDWAEAQLDADREAFANVLNKDGRRKVTANDGLHRGWLLGWSTESVVSGIAREDGQILTVGIVELEDGEVSLHHADDIKFEEWEGKEN